MKRDKDLIVRDMKEKGNMNYEESEKLELSVPRGENNQRVGACSSQGNKFSFQFLKK